VRDADRAFSWKARVRIAPLVFKGWLADARYER
jgi:hypothetical protein